MNDQPSDAAILERARSLVNEGCWTVALQLRRLHGTEPEDDDFLTRKLADFQFLVVTLRRLRRAAHIATNIATAADQIHEAIARFDAALPGLATMRNVGEHIDDYALDNTRRHHRGINRRMLQVASWDDTTYRWLGIDFKSTPHSPPPNNSSTPSATPTAIWSKPTADLRTSRH